MGNKQLMQNPLSARLADDGNIKQINAAVTLGEYECFSSIGTLTADITVTLPPLSICENKTFLIACGTTGTNTVTVAPTSGELIHAKEGSIPSIVWGNPTAGEVLVLHNVGGRRWVVLGQDMQSISFAAAVSIKPNQTDALKAASDSSGSYTVTLPALSTVPAGRLFTLRSSSASTGTITLAPSGSDVIYGVDGAAKGTRSWASPADGDLLILLAAPKGWVVLVNVGFTLS